MSYCFRLCVFCLLAFPSNLIAQDEPVVQDSVRTGYATGTLSLPNPNSIVAAYEYDPILDRYIYTETLGTYNLSIPLILTSEEYQELVIQEEIRNYFKQKNNAIAENRDPDPDAQRDALPGYYVNSSFFENIFGGREIEVVPQGSVAMDLGLLYTKQDNPAFSPRNRSNLTFDFDQRIQLSLLGNVGTKLKVIANYDTESTFDFQNQLRLEYTPNEDDIIQKIEVGNVNMPLNSALIQGAQSLFGFKTELQFGKTRITGVFSEQKSQRRTVNVEGGATIEEFEKFAIDYDQDRHFFLAHYFRDTYDRSLENYPFVNSNIQIQRIQVWVTNRTNNIQNLNDTRNIVGIQDLGESNTPGNIRLDNPPAGFFNRPPGAFPNNTNNDFNPFGINGPGESILTPAIRDISTVQNGFGGLPVSEGSDYAKLENARQLKSNEFILHPRLGYISLNQRLSNDEVLAVAFQYTLNGQVYQVGEFANDGIDANIEGGADGIRVNQNLVVKLLKSTLTNVNEPIWDLMMKNIYGLGAFQLERDDFRLNILYTDPQPLNYITAAEDGNLPLPEDVEQTTLLRVFNLDRLNNNNDPVNGGDGFFDYVPGITIDPQNGLVIFTTVEPFGEHLFKKLDNTPNTGGEDYNLPETYNPNQKKYVFRELYRTTKIQAEQEAADKNKFQLKGRYKSANVEGIPIGFNLPQGSVTVTAGGRVLQEGVDYVVNYQLGRVQIIDDALLASDIPIQINTENNALFGQQSKRFMGINVEHLFSDKLLVGGTFLSLKERPLTQKANYGYEPVNNSIYGLNASYNTDVPFLTRLVNKLPNIDTDVPSNISVRGEFAYLQPGTPQVSDFGEKATTYIDDFESSQTSISINNPLGWELSSVPLGFGGELANGDLASGYKRAKMWWYTIDPIFYSSQRPDGISDSDLSSFASRRVFLDEIFPNTDVVQGQPQVIFTMDVTFDPSERGAYNYNPSAAGGSSLNNPKENFGGISRAISSTNFEQSNVEFIQFWVMDPYIYPENAGNSGGKITFNLGNISEDVLKDGRKQYENGLPQDGSTSNTISTAFGRVPADQSLIYAFNTDGQERINQDVGFDGLNDADEAQQFPNFANLNDPSADNYQYFLNTTGSIVDRYRNYNGTDGNSPPELGATNRGNNTLPTTEDLNRDNTMNTVNSYFEYDIDIFPGMNIDNNPYITDVKESMAPLPNGQEIPVRWVQFKVPIFEPTGSKGGIADFRSIRFMRLVLSDFERRTVLRFGTMDLVRGDYRRYNRSLDPENPGQPVQEGTLFEVSAVNIEENENREPIPYVLPPGVIREELFNNNTNIRQNEQSLSLRVCGLEPQDARAVYKNFQVDMRQYKNLEMFLHAESLVNQIQLKDGQLIAFIRMGTDFTENYYQIEIPLTATMFGAASADEIWPESNRLLLPLDLLQKVKTKVLGDPSFRPTEVNYFDEELNPADPDDPYQIGQLRIGVKGNPSFGNIRLLMLGVKNGSPSNTASDICGEVWFNELRLTDLDSEGGWASILNMDANVADFATVSGTGRISTIGFGSLEQGPNQRSREDFQQYDVVTNINAGQLLPQKWGIKIPFNYSRGEELVTPKYDQQYLDLELKTRLDGITDAAEKARVKEQSEIYTKRQSVNVIGLRKERTGDQKPMPYDIENFTISTSYNQIDHRDFEIDESLSQNVRVGATYDYNFAPLSIEPLKNIPALDSSLYYQIFKDININPLPSNISFGSNIFRQYNEQKFRELDLTENDIGIPTLYQRNFLFDWQYRVNYNLTKSLQFSFDASNNRVIRNYIGENNFVDNSIGIWDEFFEVGTPNQHFQTLQLNYELPLAKIPVLEFVKATYSYKGDFQWQRGSEVFKSLEGIPDLGNSIQNSSVHQINAGMDMQKLYDYFKLVPRKSTPSGIKQRSAAVPTLDPDTPTKPATGPEVSRGDKSYNTMIGIVTGIKRLQVNYRENKGIFLPGYTQSIGFMGTLRPTTGFTLGRQQDVRDLAARNGWLTLYQEFNQQYTAVKNKQLDIQASMSFIPDLTIDLTAGRIYSETFSENYRVDPTSLQYESLSPYNFGNFNISTILISSAFDANDQEFSETFESFRENRLEVARRLATENGRDPNIVDEEGYPIGYGKSNQAVLLPAFLAAYSGQDAASVKLGAFRNFPLPNWEIKYTGFMRMDWFKKNFRRFSLTHGYRAGYTINQFQTNLDYNPQNPFEINQTNNFKNPMLFSNINLTEMFSPLMRIDLETNDAIRVLAEIRKDRALSLSFDNNLLTEIKGNEYILGLGYRLKDLKIVTNFGGRSRVLSSDLNFKADVAYRKNINIIRYLDLESSQVIAGQDLWAVNFTADYALSKNLTALVYYDHTFSEYAVSTAFPQTTIRSGVTLRYNFGN
ncbi:cell surface protein SprA [Gillisia limnaea]|uniref:Protein involved in gliding motility SprA n=1 Tax=Gillisia limnaea (strain DSM 15749 / LMG 21470 / R-8282) TaxID=865937 RepID=H2BYG8_GILLR|nr:cell surface protein SprA [Gillisia limnaea]EHQ03307.1 protein involved in gliding motility SprA [Gillisia limnaea DSM 15749]